MKKKVNLMHWLACGFGSGISPVAPGTMGTLVAVPIYYGLSFFRLDYYALVVLFLAAIGIFLCDKTAKDWGVHDHQSIVWDEIVGYLIAMTALPVQWNWMLAGFCLFRFFDILKPWPIGWADRQVSGGLGIMLDDVLAGMISCFILHGARYLLG